MAYSIPTLQYTLPAATDFSTNIYTALVVNSSGQAAIAGADARIVGVLQNNPSAAGRGCQIMGVGITQWKAGGTVASGASVSTNASGLAVTASAGPVVGIALVGGASGDVITVLLR